MEEHLVYVAVSYPDGQTVGEHLKSVAVYNSDLSAVYGRDVVRQPIPIPLPYRYQTSFTGNNRHVMVCTSRMRKSSYGTRWSFVVRTMCQMRHYAQTRSQIIGIEQ